MSRPADLSRSSCEAVGAGRSRRGWSTVMVGIVLCAFLVRLLIIAHTNGGDDLRIYTYFSRLPLHGLNPFATLHGGPFTSVFGNSPPLEVALFTGLLAIHDSPTTLRIAFALSDVAVLLLVGRYFRRPKRWRIGFILFYAFNPFVLFSWTAFSEDKPLLFLAIAACLLGLEEARQWLAWGSALALTVLKFLGAFFAPVLALHTSRTRGRWAIRPIGVCVVLFLLSNLPWFPESLRAFSRRDTRLTINPPNHASPTIVLARLGIYAPVEAKLLTAAAIIIVLGFFAARIIDIREAVVWSIFGGYAFLPDDAFNRVLLVTLPFMLLVNFSTARWIAIWIVSSAAALAGLVATKGVPHFAHGLAGPLRTLFGHEATLRHVFWTNLFTGLVLGLYFADVRRRRRAPLNAVASARSKPRTIAS